VFLVGKKARGRFSKISHPLKNGSDDDNLSNRSKTQNTTKTLLILYFNQIFWQNNSIRHCKYSVVK